MAGWTVFILGLLVVGFAAANQLGEIYCLPVCVGWYVLLLKASRRKKPAAP